MGLTASKETTSSSLRPTDIIFYNKLTRIQCILSYWLRNSKCKTNVKIPKDIILLISKFDSSYYITSINNTSNISNFLKTSKKNPKKVIMFGLKSSGKTSIRLAINSAKVKIVSYIGIGFSTDYFEYKNLEIATLNLSEQQNIKELLRNYYQNIKGVIFVIDSSDREKIKMVKEFEYILNEEGLKKCHLLILANKQDLKNAMNVKEIYEVLGLEKIKDRKWNIQGCVATKSAGLKEGLDWLCQFS